VSGDRANRDESEGPSAFSAHLSEPPGDNCRPCSRSAPGRHPSWRPRSRCPGHSPRGTRSGPGPGPRWPPRGRCPEHSRPSSRPASAHRPDSPRRAHSRCDQVIRKTPGLKSGLWCGPGFQPVSRPSYAGKMPVPRAGRHQPPRISLRRIASKKPRRKSNRILKKSNESLACDVYLRCRLRASRSLAIRQTVGAVNRA
jgi:hypothetical protein